MRPSDVRIIQPISLYGLDNPGKRSRVSPFLGTMPDNMGMTDPEMILLPTQVLSRGI